MILISLDELMKFPIRINHYDKKNGSEDFVLGVEAVLDYAQNLTPVLLDEKTEKVIRYPYTDERGYEWHNPDCYTDEVGGHHDSAIGWNPHGVWCGECTRASCKSCVNEFLLPVDED